MQLYTTCAVRIPPRAALTAHVCSDNLQQCDAAPRTPLWEPPALPLTSWLDFVERNGRERKGSDKDKEGRTGRRGQREGMEEEWRGNERRKREREEFCAVVIFLWKYPGMV